VKNYFSKMKGFIIPPIEQTFSVSSGAWASFDCCKHRNNACVRSICKKPNTQVQPIEWSVLERVHSKEFLDKIQTFRHPLLQVFELEDGGVKETDPLTEEDILHVLTPLRYLVGAVIQGTLEAFTNKSIVMVPDGASHHASPSQSHGACVFSDVPLAWLELRAKTNRADLKALYIDTDVHHADGFARARVELGMQDHFFIMDAFNEEIWPCDEEDSRATKTLEYVNLPLPFRCGVSNKTYLDLIKQGLHRAETELPPVHMVFYMCSNDALKGDPLGKTNVTERAIYERDMLIVDWARKRDLPIVIFPARGYGPSSCRVARESMARIDDKYNVFKE
jgi:acetoin utilization deacetylase AcuC-like enzyme